MKEWSRIYVHETSFTVEKVGDHEYHRAKAMFRLEIGLHVSCKNGLPLHITII